MLRLRFTHRNGWGFSHFSELGHIPGSFALRPLSCYNIKLPKNTS